MRDMNGEELDDAGHFVASSLGGPPEWYNFFPQHRAVNRSIQTVRWLVPSWLQIERIMREALRNGRTHHISHKLEIFYSSHSNRPVLFFFDITFYDSSNNVQSRLNGYFNNGPSNEGMPDHRVLDESLYDEFNIDLQRAIEEVENNSSTVASPEPSTLDSDGSDDESEISDDDHEY